ncbi:hypothetical protein PFISCL1PPCAC_21085, partial [Pristionchus fissidentatus]
GCSSCSSLLLLLLRPHAGEAAGHAKRHVPLALHPLHLRGNARLLVSGEMRQQLLQQLHRRIGHVSLLGHLHLRVLDHDRVLHHLVGEHGVLLSGLVDLALLCLEARLERRVLAMDGVEGVADGARGGRLARHYQSIYDRPLVTAAASRGRRRLYEQAI